MIDQRLNPNVTPDINTTIITTTTTTSATYHTNTAESTQYNFGSIKMKFCAEVRTGEQS